MFCSIATYRFNALTSISNALLVPASSRKLEQHAPWCQCIATLGHIGPLHTRVGELPCMRNARAYAFNEASAYA
jgi:hypothetical protein